MTSKPQLSLKYYTKKPLKAIDSQQLFAEDICKTGAKRFTFTTYIDSEKDKL